MSSQREIQDEVAHVSVEVREVSTIEEYDACVRLQREAFGLPDIELSPRRHLIVSRSAGGWTLAAFAGEEMVGFVHHLVAVRGDDEIIGYSHMMAVAKSYQNKGVGAKLKWAQRERALSEGRRFIKWTWEPMRARNAHFNINRLGAVVRSYAPNFYGTDYLMPAHEGGVHLDSDRVYGEWNLDSPRVAALADGQEPPPPGEPVRAIEIPPDWPALIQADARQAQRELLRVRSEFQQAFSDSLVCAGFDRNPERPRYLLYKFQV